MKHMLFFLVLLLSISVSAQQTDSLFHKYQMIDAINRGEYSNAANLILQDTATIIPAIQYIDSVGFEKEITDSISEHVIDSLSAIGMKYYKRNEYEESIKYYKLALCLKELLNDVDENYIILVENIAELYQMTNNYLQSEKYYLKALENCDVINNCWNSTFSLAIVYHTMGNLESAISYYLECLQILEIEGKQLDINYGVTLLTLGGIYKEIQDYASAEQYLLEALCCIRENITDFYPEYTLILNELGSIYYNSGRYEDAEKKLMEALNIGKSILGKNHNQYIKSLNLLGMLQIRLGNYKDAKQYLLEALEIGETTHDLSLSYYMKTTLHNLGWFYYKVGDLELTEKYLLEELSLSNKLYGTSSTEYALSLNGIGSLYLSKGDYHQSEIYFVEALRIYNLNNIIDKHYMTIMINIALTYELKGDENLAEKYYLDAFNLAKNNFQFDEIYDNLLVRLCDLYVLKNDYNKAEQYVYLLQRLYVERYISSLNYMTEHQRSLFWQSMQTPFNKGIPIYAYRSYFVNPNIPFFSYNNELFQKGLLLSSSVIVRNSILESEDSILVSQWQELISTKQTILQLKENKIANLSFYNQRADSLEKLLVQNSAAFREHQAMWQITWDSVRNHLSPNEVAIEYFSAPLSEDSTMYCALLLRHDSEHPEMIPLFEQKEITSFMSSSGRTITNQTYDFYSNGKTISQLVWSKILPNVKEGETIYFAPSGLLHQLAIEYLPYDENSTMSDVYNMVRLSSTREIVLNKQNTEYTTATIYGGIAYDLEEDVLLAESENYAKENLLASRSIENDTLNRGNVKYLPGTKKEAESINLLLKQNNISAKLYMTAKANEESFKALSGKHSNILHIGTHGFTWTDSVAKKQDFFTQRVQLMGQEQHYDTSIDPLNRCGLLFAGANIALQGNSKNLPEGVQDGILTAKEISLMDLRDANLVVLSACETAKGDITSEGVFGLQRAFKMAGVQTIIMSLWKVSDKATQLLMTEFYNNWIGKDQSKREAFRNAQNTVRTQYEEPEYWAGFIMLD